MYVELDNVALEPDTKVALVEKVAEPNATLHIDDPASEHDARFALIWSSYTIQLCIHIFLYSNSRAAPKKTPLGGKKTPQSNFDTSKSSAQPSPRWKSLGMGKEAPPTSPQTLMPSRLGFFVLHRLYK